MRWHTLERPGELARLEQTIGSTERKIAVLAEAQVDDTLPPGELLAMVLGIIQAIDDPSPQAPGGAAGIGRGRGAPTGDPGRLTPATHGSAVLLSLGRRAKC